MAEKFTFFWSGPFSQWHSCKFVVDKVIYNCAEQYMMAEKARLFGDEDSLKLIMDSSSPSDQKNIGRNVKNFDVKLWTENAKLIVYRGNFAKFAQNADLRNKIQKTEGTTLVESSPVDTIWGIGLHKSDPACLDRSTWLGKNWLGEILTLVRDDLKFCLGNQIVAALPEHLVK